MKMNRLLVVGLALVGSTLGGIANAAGETQPREVDALQMLERIASAARELKYKGTFVYQHGVRFETSRIAHYVDADGEHEKLETLDGPRREIIRNNDEVLCYYPDAKVVRSQKRVAERSFPALVPEQLSNITSHYTVRTGQSERVAGFESHALVLEPKDGMRYGHKLWADTTTGLLLKAITLDERGQVVEQFAFTELVIGTAITKDMVAPSYKVSYPEWRLDKFAQATLSEAEGGWTVQQFPPGFRKIMEMRRTSTRKGHKTVVTHMVFSDGMAAISVFIESKSGNTVREGLVQQGAINVYRRNVGDQFVTVIGEAPAATVMQIGDSVVSK